MEELEWLVLDKDAEGERALLITSDCIACMPYHTEKKEITWQDSSLRQWLNQVFIQEAFSEEEKSRIVESDIETRVDEDAVIETNDKVFLLNDDEAKNYFSGKKSRLAGVSAVIRKEIEEAEKEKVEEDGSLEPAVSELTDAVFWWLRTPGDAHDCAECVGAEGSIVTSGYLVIQPNFGVRPAVWIELD